MTCCCVASPQVKGGKGRTIHETDPQIVPPPPPQSKVCVPNVGRTPGVSLLAGRRALTFVVGGGGYFKLHNRNFLFCSKETSWNCQRDIRSPRWEQGKGHLLIYIMTLHNTPQNVVEV